MGKGCLVRLVVTVLLLASARAALAAEFISRVEFDSNVNRGIAQRKSDGSFTVLLSGEKQAAGESRLEWVYDGALQAAGYFTYSDLDYVDLSASAALLYRPRAGVTAAIRPFASLRGVKDSAQSAVTLGAQASVTEQLSPALSLTEYYVYRQAFAREDTYSYGMQTGGITASILLARNLTADLNYELSYGDSFVSPDPRRGPGEGGGPGEEGGNAGASGEQRGRDARFSPAFGQIVIKEKITLHTLGARVQIDLAPAWFCALRYSYGAWTGSSGSSFVNFGALSLGWRF